MATRTRLWGWPHFDYMEERIGRLDDTLTISRTPFMTFMNQTCLTIMHVWIQCSLPRTLILNISWAHPFRTLEPTLLGWTLKGRGKELHTLSPRALSPFSATALLVVTESHQTSINVLRPFLWVSYFIALRTMLQLSMGVFLTVCIYM